MRGHTRMLARQPMFCVKFQLQNSTWSTGDGGLPAGRGRADHGASPFALHDLSVTHSRIAMRNATPGRTASPTASIPGRQDSIPVLPKLPAWRMHRQAQRQLISPRAKCELAADAKLAGGGGQLAGHGGAAAAAATAGSLHQRLQENHL